MNLKKILKLVRSAKLAVLLLIVTCLLPVFTAHAQFLEAERTLVRLPTKYTGHYALVVDCQDYLSLDMTEKASDIKLRNDLFQKYLKRTGFNVSRVSNPQGPQLKRCFDDFFKKYGQSGNRLVILFDGVSYRDNFLDETYLVPVEADKRSKAAFYKSLLSLSDLLNSAQKMKSGHLLFLMNTEMEDARLKARFNDKMDVRRQNPGAQLVCEFITAGRRPGKVFFDRLASSLMQTQATSLLTGHDLGKQFAEDRTGNFQFRDDRDGTIFLNTGTLNQFLSDYRMLVQQEAQIVKREQWTERRERKRPDWREKYGKPETDKDLENERDRHNGKSDSEDKDKSQKKKNIDPPIVFEVLLKLNAFEKEIDSLLATGYRRESQTILNVKAKRDAYLMSQRMRVEKELKASVSAYKVLKREMHDYATPVVQMKKRVERLDALNERIQVLVRDTEIENLLTRIRALSEQRHPKETLALIDALLKLDPSNSVMLGKKKRILAMLMTRRLKPVTNSVGMTLAYIPAGTFEMGSPEDEKGRVINETIRRVTISKPFYMGTTEVTQKQWVKIMGASLMQRQNVYRPWIIKGSGDQHPMYYISWHEANDFCRKLSQNEGKTYRLPTEAEWEYACRAGSKGPWAGILSEMGWYYNNSRRSTNPVAQKKANDWGLYDMHGNVREWCQDWFGKYEGYRQTDPQGKSSGSFKAVRGGSWVGNPESCRSAFRHYQGPNQGRNTIGFRVVLEK